jgi:carbonic anhydrase
MTTRAQTKSSPQSKVEAQPTSNAVEGFTSTHLWVDDNADCMVVTCSDHRFLTHYREFVSHLGFKSPHTISVPGGIALTDPIAAVAGFLSKAADQLIEKVVRGKHITQIICIAHQDCGAYKAGTLHVVDALVRQAAGKSVRDFQIGHLKKSAKRLSMLAPGVKARLFLAEVVKGDEGNRVHFIEVEV